ncbi:hypothetical protein [Candidatus Laterigemmans baculatus]|uniref:hypothetical protein n=1 Tax=Candidatus Laterigemmans baculatus TaxID=2770505 RepID=UPI0013DC0751|nr:hypothetical protein [Candidatus Laterigemmans baculatus]
MPPAEMEDIGFHHFVVVFVVAQLWCCASESLPMDGTAGAILMMAHWGTAIEPTPPSAGAVQK